MYVTGVVVPLELWEVEEMECPRVMDPDDETLKSKTVISRRTCNWWKTTRDSERVPWSGLGLCLRAARAALGVGDRSRHGTVGVADLREDRFFNRLGDRMDEIEERGM